MGDVGLNIYDDSTDKGNKKKISQLGYNLYCLRGNHELRASQVANIQKIWDDEVNNYVYYENEFPNIRYFLDGHEYMLHEHRILVIGGAYSVDMYFRRQTSRFWNPQEQLTKEEMEQISKNVKGQSYDFVLSHTCPLRYQPTDLFLGCIDQSMVDNSMEVWMDKLTDDIDWGVWLFGHYHKDRVEAPCVEQFYTEVEDIETIWNRWHGKKTFKDEWWLPLSPSMEKWCEKEYEV